MQLRPPSDRLSELGLMWKGFHLVVARFEPENHVDMMVAGYVRSNARLPLVVVGSAPYAAEYTRRVRSAAGHDARVHLLGGVYDQDLLDQLYAGALCYLHGHSVGGTNPSLLRAMGAGSAVLAWDVSFNREVAAERGRFFDDDSSLAALIEAVEAAPTEAQLDGVALREIVRTNYRWDDVAVAYEALAGELASGASSRVRVRPGTRTRRAASNQEPHDRVLPGRCAREAPLSTRIGYAGGAFDLFHVGHLNILRHAKAHCDFLIAGVVTDEMLLLTKGVAPVVPFAERSRDRPPHHVRRRRARRDLPDKLDTWREVGFDIIFKGDDWRGTERGLRLEARFAEVGVEVVYFPYTVHTSSTALRIALQSLNREAVGPERTAEAE